jgi:rubrerythrin
MKNLLIKTHELWIATLMASFMAKNGESKRVLDDFSDIIFRHFTWVEKYLIDRDIEYDYNRDTVAIKVDNLKVMLHNILNRITDIELILNLLEDDDLKSRIQTDLNYISFIVDTLEDEKVDAFDANRKYKDYNLSKEATDAFTLFLFEESYKEYELIMIYNYLKAHSSDDYLNKIFQILVDESFFHLKSFGQMMAEMGILGVPRVIHKSLYVIEDVKEFLKDGIDEELAAKEECKKLSEAVAKDSEPLAKFFDFINYQENYHIRLMQDALKYYESRSS